MASFTAGQGGGEGLLNGLTEMIKTEVSNQMKIERKVIKEEILKEIQSENEKNDGIRKDLDSTKEGNCKNIILVCLKLRIYSISCLLSQL